ncbi:hypothetical protein ECANGB1_532 [Enterospora canceri]|uniref:Uncharacterized protein n=1 Tax=Enterospora canceri TaxID=1081671 RepID=A0A1Y1S8N6_9MICR|nr:hypothetical protein ECANGB1_532 [Enterospora canceri]
MEDLIIECAMHTISYTNKYLITLVQPVMLGCYIAFDISDQEPENQKYLIVALLYVLWVFLSLATILGFGLMRCVSVLLSSFACNSILQSCRNCYGYLILNQNEPAAPFDYGFLYQYLVYLMHKNGMSIYMPPNWNFDFSDDIACSNRLTKELYLWSFVAIISVLITIMMMQYFDGMVWQFTLFATSVGLRVVYSIWNTDSGKWLALCIFAIVIVSCVVVICIRAMAPLLVVLEYFYFLVFMQMLLLCTALNHKIVGIIVHLNQNDACEDKEYVFMVFMVMNMIAIALWTICLLINAKSLQR